jgi:CubicO group peptidase (beta-lactamase class C family)
MAHYHVPGLSVAVIDSGRIAWAAGFGVKEAGSNDSVNSETLFQAGSISKPTSALAVMRLVQEGRLDLDEDVNRKLKSWKVPENRFTRTEKVTLRRILSHTAGLTVHGFPGYEVGATVPTVVQILDGIRPANTGPVRVDTVPGAISRYSGGGTTVAMLLLTDVTGKPFPALMREMVLGPAGMTHSTYDQPLPPSLAPDAASGHSNTGGLVKGRYHTYPEMSAAGLWTTAPDLARLAIELQRAYAGRSAKVVARPTLLTMLRVQPPEVDSGFALGYHVSGSGHDLEFSHGGADVGFRASFVAFAERGQGAVIMTNGDNGDQLIDELLASIAAEYHWPSHHPVVKQLVRKDSTALADFAGSYALDAGGPKPVPAVVSIESGRLFLDVPLGGLDKSELLADSDTTFFLRGSGIPVVFRRDRTGAVARIVIDGSVTGKKTERR